MKRFMRAFSSGVTCLTLLLLVAVLSVPSIAQIPGGGAAVVSLPAGTNGIGKTGPGYTSAQTPITASSGNVANASAIATLAAAAGKNTYITGFQITSDGATTALCVNPTVVGAIGGTMTYTYCAPAGVLLSATPLIVPFPQPVISSAVNTAIVVTLPALGTGSTNATVVAQGYQE